MRRLPLLCSLLLCAPLLAWGQSAYPFLRLPSAPLLAAAGGVQPGWGAQDAAVSAAQPALYGRGQDRQLSAAFMGNWSGRGYHLFGARHSERRGWTVGGGISFTDYGTVEATDASGNSGGTFRAADYVLQVSGARAYGARWRYGFTAKWIGSSYAQYRSAGIAADAGIFYSDSARGFSFGVAARHMGAMLKSYAGTPEALPFDLQAGIHQKLIGSPLAFSIGVQSLHRLDLGYRDSLFAADNGLPVAGSAGARILRHFTVAAHVTLLPQLEGILGYAPLRTFELATGAGGAPGLHFGLRARFRRLSFSAARAGGTQVALTIVL